MMCQPEPAAVVATVLDSMIAWMRKKGNIQSVQLRDSRNDSEAHFNDIHCLIMKLRQLLQRLPELLQLSVSGGPLLLVSIDTQYRIMSVGWLVHPLPCKDNLFKTSIVTRNAYSNPAAVVFG